MAPSLSGVPLILSASAPLNRVSRTSFTVTSEVKVSERFIGGVVYCGVASASTPSPAGIPTTITSTEAIKQQAYFTTLILPADHSVSESFFVDVLIDNLSPLTAYDVFCYAEDWIGSGGQFDADLIATPVTTACCHEISFSENPPRYILSDMAKYFEMSEGAREDTYAVKFELSALPPSAVSVSLRVSGNSSVVEMMPSELVFTLDSTELSGSFLLSSSGAGVFSVFLTHQGESFGLFRTDGTGVVLSVVGDDTVALPPPQVTTVYFDASGSTMYVNFNSPTNMAAGVVNSNGMWPCDLVFSFEGAETSGCQWEGSSRVKVVFNYYPSTETPTYPVVGGGVSLLPGVIKAFCVFDS